MSRFIPKQAKTFKKNEKGVTMLEYGLIAALVAVVAAVGFTTLGTKLNTQIGSIATTISK
jgi:pilus assembly protein Flp/PilA